MTPARRVRARGVGVVSVVLACCSLLLGVHLQLAGAAANTEPLDPSLTQVAVELLRSEAELAKVETALHDAEIGIAATQASLNVTLGLLQQNSAARAEVVKLIKAQSVAAYMHSGSAVSAPLQVDQTAQLGSARQYAGAATAVDASELTRLNELNDRLTTVEDEKRTAHDDVVTERDELKRRRADLVAAIDADRARLTTAGAIPVMGDSVLNAKQVAGWFHATGATPRLAAGTTIDDVAVLYVEEGTAEGVRGDLAFAQAIIETGSFSVAAGNNYSGIGVCDSCSGGYGFPTPRDGVRAQIQLLKNYADPSSRAATLAHPPSPALYGSDPQKAARLYDGFFLKGKAPLWNLMGRGNWATDPVYAPKVIDVFNQMVRFANVHPELA